MAGQLTRNKKGSQGEAGPFFKTCPIVAQWGVPRWEVGDVGRSKGVSVKYATCQLKGLSAHDKGASARGLHLCG